MRKRVPGSVKLDDRVKLAELEKKRGRKILKEVTTIASPETILGWYNKLIAKKLDRGKKNGLPGLV
ncbi:MAG: hypothetical protein K8T20_08260 [Planctomycetes bacterium]|nr:hypothetical protein [Planctomycetota bacterium]